MIWKRGHENLDYNSRGERVSTNYYKDKTAETKGSYKELYSIIFFRNLPFVIFLILEIQNSLFKLLIEIVCI